MKKVFCFIWKSLKLIKGFVVFIASCLFIGIILGCFGFVLSLYVGFNNASKVAQIEDGALVIKFKDSLNDYVATDPLLSIIDKINDQIPTENSSTFKIVEAIRLAKTDPHIKGIVLDLNKLTSANLPSIKYIGKALTEFKEGNGKKEIIAIADNYTQIQYALASYATKIYMQPMGEVSIKGLSYTNLYYKDLLDKLKISTHVFKVGKYKSAVEPFLRNNMSNDAKQNSQTLLNQTWASYKDIIQQNRKIKDTVFDLSTDNLLANLTTYDGDTGKYALELGLVDKLVTKGQLTNIFTVLFGYNSDKGYAQIPLTRYLQQTKQREKEKNKNILDEIAVIHIEGTIVEGSEREARINEVTGNSIVTALKEASDNPVVKAIILRINSPGGSVFASEKIRQEIDVIKQYTHKPIVVSMGDMAASGGYWIASAADYIVADTDTLTGSIGIFGVAMTINNTLANIGVHSDGVANSELANNSLVQPMNKAMQKAYQLQIDNGYLRFITLVSQARNLSLKDVDQVAQGKVWIGRDALEHKLVDQLGDFDVAVAQAKKLLAKNGYKEPIKLKVYRYNRYKRYPFLKNLFANTEITTANILVKQVLGVSLGNDVNSLLKQSPLYKFRDPKNMFLYCLTCGDIK